MGVGKVSAIVTLLQGIVNLWKNIFKKKEKKKEGVMKSRGAFLGLILFLSLTACATIKQEVKDWWIEHKPTSETPTETTPATPTTPTETTPTTPTETTPATPTTSTDALDLSTVETWYGTKVTTSNITATISAASIKGDYLNTTYSKYDWPSKTVKVEVDAVAYLFYKKDGKVVGGKFDWWRKGGQAKKGLENVHNGYQGHSMPASGTDTWTMIASTDGKQRSNTCAVKW